MFDEAIPVNPLNSRFVEDSFTAVSFFEKNIRSFSFNRSCDNWSSPRMLCRVVSLIASISVEFSGSISLLMVINIKRLCISTGAGKIGRQGVKPTRKKSEI